jgi:septal ring factor EnvC (AmiA/AmiB activator)
MSKINNETKTAMAYLFIALIAIAITGLISVLWVNGIDHMKENHPNYKGEDLFSDIDTTSIKSDIDSLSKIIKSQKQDIIDLRNQIDILEDELNAKEDEISYLGHKLTDKKNNE